MVTFGFDRRDENSKSKWDSRCSSSSASTSRNSSSHHILHCVVASQIPRLPSARGSLFNSDHGRPFRRSVTSVRPHRGSVITSLLFKYHRRKRRTPRRHLSTCKALLAVSGTCQLPPSLPHYKFLT
ncbi:hypothetical protein BHE74_00025247 [Ensete ventricosum]|nr:hypothetical protein BHE74_00025247 [Ensete ventricosum]RZS05408.1 hypothetical protein BHM03_00035921 [Ensete ventricosum]